MQVGLRRRRRISGFGEAFAGRAAREAPARGPNDFFNHVIGPMVAIGRGTKDPWPKPGQLELSEVVVQNRF